MNENGTLEHVLESLHRIRNASSLHTLFSMSEILQAANGGTISVGAMKTLLQFVRAEEGLDNLEFSEIQDAVVVFHAFKTVNWLNAQTVCHCGCMNASTLSFMCI